MDNLLTVADTMDRIAALTYALELVAKDHSGCRYQPDVAFNVSRAIQEECRRAQQVLQDARATKELRSEAGS